MFDHDIPSLPAGQDLSATPVGTRLKWTANGVQIANAGDVAIGTLWRGNDAQQIANLYLFVGNSGPACGVKMFFSNGIPWGIIGADATAFLQADQLSAGDNGTYVHPAGGSPVVAQVLYGAPANSQGGQISVIPLIGIQTFLALFAAFLAFMFMLAAPTPALGASGDIVSLVRTGTENGSQYAITQMSGTDTAAGTSLPVADAGVKYVSVTGGTLNAVYVKVAPTLIQTSGTLGAGYIFNGGAGNNPIPSSIVGSGTTLTLSSSSYVIEAATSNPTTLESGSTNFFVVSSPTNGIITAGSPTWVGTNSVTLTGTIAMGASTYTVFAYGSGSTLSFSNPIEPSIQGSEFIVLSGTQFLMNGSSVLDNGSGNSYGGGVVLTATGWASTTSTNGATIVQ